jgi:hypothetical protein
MLRAMTVPAETPFTLGRSPLFDVLASSRRVLVAGAGGGFDVFGAVPLKVALEAGGTHVELANLSFTDLGLTEAEQIHEACWRVEERSPGPAYFPERTLARWMARRGAPSVVYAFPRTGVVQTKSAYQQLVAELEIDTIVLVDGGTDSLMRGTEDGLGTPVEDMTSIAAVNGLAGVTKLLCCLAFGVDAYHGVSHAHVLESVAAASRAGGFLGVTSILPGMPEADAYLDAVEFANREMPARPSIVANSVASAIEGHYGDHHRTARTGGSQLWINPLMSIYWSFRLDVIAAQSAYLAKLRETRSVEETAAIIRSHRAHANPAPWRPIPI